ncbi:MAG TPA: patatin-like phospholipase family protein [Pyrinomonadaceae bacterium]|nr:patatin-like phospholipase family protein [Pyrinomonadaceae bacterium]
MNRTIDQNAAVILSGGGAYAAYEVGVMKALFTGECHATGYQFLNPGVMTGTSAGAINVAFLASNPDTDICTLIRLLEDVWINRISANPERCGNGVFRYRGDLLRFLDARCLTDNPLRTVNEFSRDLVSLTQDFYQHALRFLITSGSFENRAVQFIDVGAFVTSEPIQTLLPRIISLDAVRRSERKLRIVTTNWSKGIVRTFENSDMTDDLGFAIIEASASLPGIFQAHDIAGDLYVDGGVLTNTPLNCAIDTGATELHVIYMDPDVQNIPLHRLQSTIEVFDRVLIITWATKVNEDVDNARRINEGLDLIERAGDFESKGELRTFIRVASRIANRDRAGLPYKRLTIHRYHPHDDLGFGALGLLNFDRDRIAALIQRGFDDTVNHDCIASHCVVPTNPTASYRG